jgi:hypothetical protein
MPTRDNLKTAFPTRPAAHAPQPADICLRCGVPELRGRSRSLFHRLFSLVVYTCDRCDYRQTRLQFSMLTLLALVAAVLVSAGAVYLVRLAKHARSDETSLSTPDALARAQRSAGSLSDYELMMLKKPRTTLDNAAIVRLWKASVGAEVIIQMIRTSNPDYDTSSNGIIELKQAGVDENIILTMIDASYNHAR